MHRKTLSCAVALLLIATGASLAAAQGSADSGVLTVRVGKAFPIVVESNPSTGYQWQVVKPLSPNIVYAGQKFTPVPTAQREVGSGGTSTLIFKAVKAGPAEIKLVYIRPWEKNEPPAKTFQKKVLVK